MHVKNHAKGITMKSLFIASLVVAGLAAVPAASAADIEVMTQNQYLGADIAPIVTAPPEEFLNEVSKALMQVAASKPTERLARLADEIAVRRPHIVGLQEVFSFKCENLSQADMCSMLPFAGAFNDHLQLTLEALAGEYYEVGTVQNLNVPLELSSFQVRITVTDRDVILARHDVLAAAVELDCPRPSPLQGCNYSVVAPVPSFPPLNVERGYVVAQALVGGRPYLFVNTHLETREPFAYFQSAQAVELVQVIGDLKALKVPVIVVGDFNSSPNDPPFIPGVLDSPYMQLAEDAGLRDIWLDRPGNVPGLTCCQAADLLNHKSQLSERIDLIWTSEPPWKVKQARVEGDTVNTKTRPPGRGLWPSDHGAVAATLQFR